METELSPWPRRHQDMQRPDRTYLVPKQLESIDILEAERTSYYQDGRVKEREVRTLTRLNFPSGVRPLLKVSNPDPIGDLLGILAGGVVIVAGIALLQNLLGER